MGAGLFPPCPPVGGQVKKSDDVRTTDSVKILTVSSVEELNTRSMSLSACPYDLLVTVGLHEQQSISRRAPPPDAALLVARADGAVERCASSFRYRIDHGISLAQCGNAWEESGLAAGRLTSESAVR